MKQKHQSITGKAMFTVRLPRELDTDLERLLAGTGLTKQEVILAGLRREMERMAKKASAA